MTVCPLIFEPIYKAKIWGGRNLALLLGKIIPEEQPIGESWECVDIPGNVSTVARGPAKSKTLQQLVNDWGPDLLGRASLIDGRFPLLIKFLDATLSLSIQVHPDEQAVRQMNLAVPVKHEAWHILQAAPGAVIYRGLKPGATVDVLAKCVHETPDAVPDLLNALLVKQGETYYLPAGTLHALGAGVVVAEVQTPGDITFRLYDWGRTRPNSDAGMNVNEALAAIRLDADPAPFERRSHVTSVFTTVTSVVNCPSFKIEKVRFAEGIEQEIPYAELVCWVMLDGQCEVLYDRTGKESFAKGDVLLLPAGLKNARLKTLSTCSWLEVTIPAASDLAAHGRPSAEALREDLHKPALKPIQIGIGRKNA